jgi:MFS family permease
VSTPSTKPSAYAALRDHAFRRIFAASFVSQTGDWFQITGRALLVYQITGSAAALGVIYVASFVPMLLLTNVGGVIADRFDRRRIMIVCQVLSMLGALAMAALAASDTATLLNVSAISVFLGVVMAVTAPANSALLPMIVEPEHLTSAISLNSSVNSAARVVGPLLAGLMLPLVGLTWLFLLNAASFLFVIVAWALTRIVQRSRASEHGAMAAMRASLRIARDVRPIRVALVTAAVVGGIGQIYQPLAAAWATDTLADGAKSAGSQAYGLTQAAIGIGAVAGALLVARHHEQRGRTLWLTAAGTGVSLTVLGLVGWLVPAIVVCVVMGLFQYGAMALCATTIQQHVADELRGRVMSLYVITFVGFYPILGVLGGLVANQTGVPPLFVAAGVAILLYLVPLARWAPAIDTPPTAVPHYLIDESEAEAAFAVEELTAATESPVAGWALEPEG